MAYVVNPNREKVKRSKLIRIPCVRYVGGQNFHRVLTEQGNEYNFLKKTRLPGSVPDLGRPVVNNIDLKWFLHYTRSNIFEVFVSKRRFSEDWYYEAQDELKTALEICENNKVPDKTKEIEDWMDERDETKVVDNPKNKPPKSKSKGGKK